MFPDRTSNRCPLYRWFAALVGLTSLSILLQAVTAGQFMSHQHSWLGVHDVVADVVMVLALAGWLAVQSATARRRVVANA